MCNRSLLFSVIFLLSGIIFALCFGVVDAAAELSGGRYLTFSETIEFYGDSIPCTYYNGSDFVTVQLHPTSNYVYHFGSDSSRFESTDYITSSLQWVMYYSGSISDYVSNPNYVNVDVSPNLSVFGCTDFYAAVATRCSTNGGTSQSSQPYVSTSAYDSSFFDISAAGQTLRYSNSLLTTSDNSRFLCPCMTRDGLSSYWSCVYVPVEWHSSSATNVSTLRAGFFGATRNGGGSSARFEVYLSTPYIAPSDSNVETGIASGSSGGSTIINNNVDMTETNSLLDRIKSGISGLGDGLSSLGTHILDGIASIFVPSEGFMDEQIQEVKDSFVWYEQIQAVGNDLKTVFGQEEFNEAPIVTLHASQMKSSWSGKYYFSEDEVLLDFADFADYRGSIHTILSVLLWVFFLWRLFARLPDIIHGAGIATADTLNISRELDGRCDDAAQDVVNSSSRFFR